jgi:hypothetical protein
MFHSPIAQAGLAFMGLTCVFAAIRGAWPERLAAGFLAMAWIGSEALEDLSVFRHPMLRLHVQPAIAAIDSAYAALLLVILLRTRRRWVIFAFSAALLIVLIHTVTAIDPRITQFDFFSAYYLLSYVVVAALGLGALCEGRTRLIAPRPKRPLPTPTAGLS